MAHSHRPGGLHQSNKPFKTRHSTKGSVKAKQNGKVSRPVGRSGPKSKSVVGNKVNRRNAAKINMQKKREEEKMSRRMFSCKDGVPQIGVLVSLCPDVNVESAYSALVKSMEIDNSKQESMDFEKTSSSVIGHMDIRSRFKQSIQWIKISRNGKSAYSYLMDLLDAMKAADFCVFLLSAQEEVDRLGYTTLSSLKAQGLPACFSLVQNMNDAPQKKHSDIKRSLSLFMHEQVAVDMKMHVQECEGDLVHLLRSLTSSKPQSISWRDLHPYLLVDSIEHQEQESVLKVSGFSRGHPFSADRLVHLPGFGDFEVEKIVEHSANGSHSKEYFPNMNFKQSMVFENPPEFDEYLDDDVHSSSMAMMDEKVVSLKKKVPKGTSSYQAEWIAISENEDEENESDLDSVDMEVDGSMSANQDQWLSGSESGMDDSENENEIVELEGKVDDVDDMDDEEQDRRLEEYLQSKKCNDTPEDDLEFPDEVPTPTDLPVRYRFRKYRGLKSFRTSPWDPYENLPLDFSRIFQFDSFAKSKKKWIVASEEERILAASAGAEVTMKEQDGFFMEFNGPAAGKRISIFLKHVSKEVLDFYKQDERVLVVFGLLPHEEKISMINMTCTRPKNPPGLLNDDEEENTPIVKNKDELIIQCGFRRFKQRLLFSQNSSGKLHKMERFLHPGRSIMASCYGQAIISNCPVLYFIPPLLDRAEYSPYLIATGVLESVDPNRMVIKRKILTGVPTRIHPSSHRNTAIIRFMFFNKEDVEYFKPVELRTKLGRRGHILNSIGTHGAMKCGFDKPLKSMDTVCMLLYKRAYPKYPESGYNSLFGVQVVESEKKLRAEILKANLDGKDEMAE